MTDSILEKSAMPAGVAGTSAGAKPERRKLRPGSGRKINREVKRILDSGSLDELLAYCRKAPAEKVVNALIQAFYRADSEARWWAITAFGQVAARVAAKDMERARVLMRRLMWSLNDESGGIGWSAPEAMAEAMANSRPLAEEYCRILLSYIREDGNFLEHLPLRRGALWGVMRLAQCHRDLFSEIQACLYLTPYLSDPDPESRALAALAAGFGGCLELEGQLSCLKSDGSEVKIWLVSECVGGGDDGTSSQPAQEGMSAGLKDMTVAEAAGYSLSRLGA